MRRVGATTVLALATGLLVAHGGCATQGVRPDETSAAGHRQEATQERARANEELGRFAAERRAQTPGLYAAGRDTEIGAIPAQIDTYNPSQVALAEAEERLAHARAHEQAAAVLERDEEEACREVPKTARAACPLLGPSRVEDVPGGVRLHLPPGAPVAELAAALRCQLAAARTQAFAGPLCPLTLKGTRVERPAPDAIDLLAATRDGEAELRARARRLVGGSRLGPIF